MLGKKLREKIVDDINETNSILREMKNMVRDSSIRVHDIQDRVYDVLWQIKVQNHQRDMMFWQIYKRPDEELEDAQLRFFRSLPKAEGQDRKVQLLNVPLLQFIHEDCEKNGLSYWLNFGTLLGAYRHGGFIPWDDDTDIGMMRADAEKLRDVLRGDPRVGVRDLVYNAKTNPNGPHRIFQVRYAADEAGILDHFVDIFCYDYAEKGGEAAQEYIRKQRRKLMDAAGQYPRSVPKTEHNPPEVDAPLNKLMDEYMEDAVKELGITKEPGPNIVWSFDNCDYPYGDLSYEYDMIFPLKTMEFEGCTFCVPNKYKEYLNILYDDFFSLPQDILSHKHHSYYEEKTKKQDHYYEKYVRKELAEKSVRDGAPDDRA